MTRSGSLNRTSERRPEASPASVDEGQVHLGVQESLAQVQGGFFAQLHVRIEVGLTEGAEDPTDYRFLLPWNIPKEPLMDFESGRLA